MNENPERINCHHCIYFTVTWEPRFPKACRLFGIKSAQMPSVVVFNSTGEPCNAFTRK